MEYGLTPNAVSAIVAGWAAAALSLWLAYRRRNARVRESARGL